MASSPLFVFNWKNLLTIVKYVVLAMIIMLIGTMVRNILYVMNMRYYTNVPWAIVPLGVFLWYFWRYLRGDGPPSQTKQKRNSLLRANHVSRSLWIWSMIAGIAGIIMLVVFLYLSNRMVLLPKQNLPDLSSVPRSTMIALLLFGAPVAGLIEESSFRGYMQGPIERSSGLFIAIIITGTMFAVAHLDFTLILWPYYVTVAAIYGIITHLTNSILPSVMLHTLGNTYSNMDLYFFGRAEWQAPLESKLIWTAGVDQQFIIILLVFAMMIAVTIVSFLRLKQVAMKERQGAR